MLATAASHSLRYPFSTTEGVVQHEQRRMASLFTALPRQAGLRVCPQLTRHLRHQPVTALAQPYRKVQAGAASLKAEDSAATETLTAHVPDLHRSFAASAASVGIPYQELSVGELASGLWRGHACAGSTGGEGGRRSRAAVPPRQPAATTWRECQPPPPPLPPPPPTSSCTLPISSSLPVQACHGRRLRMSAGWR